MNKNSQKLNFFQSTIYLAGPEVFYPNAKEIGRKAKLLIKYQEFATAIFPLDAELTAPTQDELAQKIVDNNMESIKKADFVLANLSNFRGSKHHPSCDSGTAWEVGYALALGKIVVGYTLEKNVPSIPAEIVKNLHLCLEISSLYELFNISSRIIINSKNSMLIDFLKEDEIFDLDPEFSDIQDANPETAFILGYRTGKGFKSKAKLSDLRTQVEKFGTVDLNGNTVEDFNSSVNIMISKNCDILQK